MTSDMTCSCGQGGIAAEVLVAANEIRQMENGIFAGTLTPSMFDAAEARRILEGASTGARLDDARGRFSRIYVAN